MLGDWFPATTRGSKSEETLRGPVTNQQIKATRSYNAIWQYLPTPMGAKAWAASTSDPEATHLSSKYVALPEGVGAMAEQKHSSMA